MNGSSPIRPVLGLAALFLLCALAIPSVEAGTTGKISGRAIDSESGEALPGVTVFVEGTRLGAIADAQGRFNILNVDPGQYTLRSRLVGYNDFVVTNVEIIPDFTTEVQIRMVPEAVQQQEVVVQAERPLIQKDATGTTRFITAEELEKQPIRGYRDAAANQTGVVNFQQQFAFEEAQNNNTLIVRGGRPNEVAFFVDGFSQQDPLTGTSSTSINQNAIQEVVVLTGGFSPEYGRIMSGAVNVITREGGAEYFGSLEAVSDFASGDWIDTRRQDYNIYDASLGGPLIPNRDDVTFFVSGERRWQRDRAPAFMTGGFRSELESLGLDPDVQPNNWSEGWTWQGKLAWRVNDQMNLKAGTLGSEEDWRQYNHAYLFNLDHSPRYRDENRSYFADFNHAVNKNTFWTAGLNYFVTERKRGDGVHFDDLSGYFRSPNPRFDPNLPLFWLEGHVFDDFLQRKSSYWGLQGSVTSQVNPYHQLKVGGDFQRHTLRFFQHFFPIQLGGSNPNLVDFDAYGYGIDTTNGQMRVIEIEDGDIAGIQGLDGPKHPKTWAVFAQDKYEREGVIVNGGLRLDHINVDTPALRSDLLPLGDPDADPGNLPDSLESADLQENKTYSRISPRLGVAFPVDEKTLLRFNYGQFYQQPNLRDLYVSYRFLQHKIRTGGYFVGFGNPNLRPELTTAYEVGAARQLGDNLRLDMTAYWKDVKDLVEITTIPSFPNNFSSYRNRDFATIKGIDLGLTMRPINHISANVAYSLSYAKGTGSVSNTQRNIAWTADETPKQTAPLTFDQRHKLSVNLDWSLGRGEGPIWGTGFRPLENTGVNLLFNAGSGTPFTPTFVFNEVTLAAVASQPSGPLNSRYGPWTINLDAKVSRGFFVGDFKLDAYVWVLNVFDRKNPIQVYNSSGSALTTNWLDTQDGQTFLETAANEGVDGEALYRLAENNPTLFSNPRLVRLGLRTSF